MKVFRKELYKKAMGLTEEECEHLRWPLQCDGEVVSETGAMEGRDGKRYSAVDAWCEEVTDLDCQSDVDAMKEWAIGTEHVVRKNGKETRVVVRSFNSDSCGGDSCGDCALNNACHGEFPCSLSERTAEGEVYFKEVAEHKPLVLNLFFSPEHNMTFTEHNVNPDVGFETGKYYRYKGTASKMQRTTVLDCLVHKCVSVTKSERPSRDCKAVMLKEYVFTFDNSATVKVASKQHEPTFSHVTKSFVEMRPLVVAKAPDVITLDEGVNMKWDDIEGTLTCKLPQDCTFVFDAVCGRTEVEPNIKEKPKMKIDKDFTFTKKAEGNRLHEPKVCRTKKAYANAGACEVCGATIQKGDFVLTANEISGSKWSHDVRTVKTHRLCASCTAEYIKAKSGVGVGQTQSKKDPLYQQKFDKWVKDFEVKKGTKVRILRDFDRDNDTGTIGHYGVAGCTGTIRIVGEYFVDVELDGLGVEYTIPYYVLDIIKEPTYAERQAQWVRENNVKVGVTVRITKGFSDKEDGSRCCEHLDAKGKLGVVYAIKDRWLELELKGERAWWSVPYTAIEVVKEQTYEERQEQWVRENNVKVSTKVRITRPFTTNEDGCDIPNTEAKNSFIGDDCEVIKIGRGGLYVKSNAKHDWWIYPYFVLEVVATEPTYEDKFRAWVKENNVKKGDRFVITLGYWEESNEMGCIKRTGMYGKKGKLTRVSSEYRCFLNAELADGTPLTVPYNAIQILKEPWFNVGDKVRILMKASGMYNEVGVVTRIDVYKNGEQLVMVKFKDQLPKGFRASKKEDIAEVVKEPSYKELQDAWVAKHNLKEGDKVVVLRKAESHENEWPNSWCGVMDCRVGQMFTVENVFDKGIRLSCGFSWPYFVLGVVKE